MQISKNDDLLHFIGTVDELNSHLGLVKALIQDKETKQFLEQIQKILMKLMSHAFDPLNEKYFISNEEAVILENETGKLEKNLPEVHQFIIPGSNVTEAQIHITRTVTRRAERLFYAVNIQLNREAGKYLNQLSNYLFTLSQQHQSSKSDSPSSSSSSSSGGSN